MIPRPEHPKPQFQRDSWQNLNGTWEFEIDHGNSGQARGLYAPDVSLGGTITVPFCPECKLSGVENKDFMRSVWYRRTVQLTPEQCAGRVFLHFGAVDYACFAYVNGEKVGYHKGGYVSFKFEITKFVHPGENVITVNAQDDNRDPLVPRGKQSELYYSHDCDYTRTTGIWQTVWLEFTPKAYIKSMHCQADPNAATAVLTLQVEGQADLTAKAFYEGKLVGQAAAANAQGEIILPLTVSEVHLWEAGHGRLYDLELCYGEDTVHSYFGLRSICLDGMKFRINGKSVFQRLILDQGFYPDGLYTAPTDADLIRDIDLSLAAGFNGARLHEKIFEERFLYHCDKKGYLVWGEYPNWGLRNADPMALYSVLPEWLEEIERDRNHPAIIGWCPLNEVWDADGHKPYADFIRMIYRVTKAVDPSRPCIDTSGGFHVETDIYDVHDYNQDPENFKATYDRLMTEGYLYDRLVESPKYVIKHAGRQKYTGGPTFLSEYGGIRYGGDVAENDMLHAWGYGKAPGSLEDFLYRYKGLTDALLDNDQMFGLCYTQLTDIEQEQNGLYYYDRTPKFDVAWLHSVMSRKAAIED